MSLMSICMHQIHTQLIHSLQHIMHTAPPPHISHTQHTPHAECPPDRRQPRDIHNHDTQSASVMVHPARAASSLESKELQW